MRGLPLPGSAPSTFAAMLRALSAALLLLLLPAAADAATVKVPVPADGQVAVAFASVTKKSSVKARGAAAVAVAGSAKKGRLAVAVVRRRGTAASGAVTLTVKGRAKGVKTYAAALAGAKAPAAACKSAASLLAKPLQAAGISAADLKAVGAAAAARVCGKSLPAGASAVLNRLGLGAAQSGGIAPPAPPASPPPASGTPTNQCSNGIDDDGDGQVDASSERQLRPDPGCMNANDPTETGEVPLACNAGAGVGDDRSVLEIGINDGCGAFVEVAIYAAPNAFVCDIAASAGNWVCVIAHGQAYADTRNATDAEMAGLTIGLNGDADCAVPVTIVLYRRNFEVAELVTPIGGCGGRR